MRTASESTLPPIALPSRVHFRVITSMAAYLRGSPRLNDYIYKQRVVLIGVSFVFLLTDDRHERCNSCPTAANNASDNWNKSFLVLLTFISFVRSVLLNLYFYFLCSFFLSFISLFLLV